MFIPGFRSNNKIKKIVAIVYYLFALLTAAAGVESFLFFVSIPFIFFSAADLIRRRGKYSKITLFVSCFIFIVAIAIFPGGSSGKSETVNNSSPSDITQNMSPAPSPTATPEASSTPLPVTVTEPIKSPAEDSTLEVHFIDVGQADSILIIQNDSAMLIDAGNNTDADIVTGYLKAEGIDGLDFVIGTHPHEDHIGGLDAVIKSFEIGTVIMPKAESTTRSFEDLLSAITSKNLKITSPVPGTRYRLGEAEFLILAPNTSTYDELNDFSVVIKLTYGLHSFLLTGDAEAGSEDEMLSGGYDLKADVLKVGHHGSDSSTTDRFLESVSPKYAVISVGGYNSYGHPAQTTMGALKKQGIITYRTDESGSIIAESDGEKITFKFQKKPTQPISTPMPSAAPAPSASQGSKGSVVIENVDLEGERVTIKNNSSTDVSLSGWRLLSVKGNQEYYFPEGIVLKAGASLTIATGDAAGDVKWNNKNTWNNDGDPAELYDHTGKLVSRE